MKKKFILGNCYLNDRIWFWHIWPQWPWSLTQWPRIDRVPVLPRTDVWTKFEEGRSRHSRVIDRKRKGYRRTNLPTDKCKAKYIPLFFEGRHNKLVVLGVQHIRVLQNAKKVYLFTFSLLPAIFSLENCRTKKNGVAFNEKLLQRLRKQWLANS